MTPYEKAWAKTKPKELGYSDHPADRGGPTHHGITERVARANGFNGDMRDLTEDRAQVIGKSQYWDVLNLDRVAALSQPIAEEMFDTLFNGGEPGKWLQRLLNVFNQRGRVYPDMGVDGRIGPMTLEALGRYLKQRGAEGERRMLKALNSLQGARFVGIAENNPTQEDFVYGWFGRVEI